MTFVSVPEIITELADLLSARDFRAARSLARTLAGSADLHDLTLIHQVSTVLENRPRTAVVILRQLWRTTDSATDRAIIAACAPKDGDAPRRRAEPAADRAPRRTRRNKREAPSTVRTTQDHGLIRARNTRQQRRTAAEFARYQAERAGVIEGEQIPDREQIAQDEQVYASGFDYDCAALHGTTQSRCLSCSIGRERYDLHTDRIKAGHGDDGLCAECRETGRPGIPELTSGHTPADSVAARCAFIRADLGDVAARVLLKTEWRQANDYHVRDAIVDYVTTNLPEKAAAPQVPELPACGTCAEPRSPRDTRGLATDDGQCAGCRTIDTADNAAA